MLTRQEIDELRCRMVIGQVEKTRGSFCDPGLAKTVAERCQELLVERQEMQKELQVPDKMVRVTVSIEQWGKMQEKQERIQELEADCFSDQELIRRLEAIKVAAILDLQEWDGLDRGYDAHGRLRQVLGEATDAS